MEQHDAVKHPFKNLKKNSDRFMDWVAERILASPVMFYTAFITPLLVLPMSSSIKEILIVVSGNWIQWWALPALQRQQNEISVKQTAKADADHDTLTYLANKLDRLESVLLHPSSKRELKAND